jgi:hypothetical protein
MYAVPRMPSRSTRPSIGGVRVEPPLPSATYFGIGAIATVAVAIVVMGIKTGGRRAGRERSEAPE